MHRSHMATSSYLADSQSSNNDDCISPRTSKVRRSMRVKLPYVGEQAVVETQSWRPSLLTANMLVKCVFCLQQCYRTKHVGAQRV
jgi:hypothetical protein